MKIGQKFYMIDAHLDIGYFGIEEIIITENHLSYSQWDEDDKLNVFSTREEAEKCIDEITKIFKKLNYKE